MEKVLSNVRALKIADVLRMTLALIAVQMHAGLVVTWPTKHTFNAIFSMEKMLKLLNDVIAIQRQNSFKPHMFEHNTMKKE